VEGSPGGSQVKERLTATGVIISPACAGSCPCFFEVHYRRMQLYAVRVLLSTGLQTPQCNIC
jgi:hypothetical protein